MNTLEIEQLMKGSGTQTLACDQLPSTVSENFIFIVNTDKISQQGTHWVVVARNHTNLIYADGLGLPPVTKQIVSFINLQMRENDTLICNRFPFQAESESTCGQWCVLIAWHLAQGFSFDTFCKYYSACPGKLLEKEWPRFIKWQSSKE
jgi:hypothetical protein